VVAAHPADLSALATQAYELIAVVAV